MILAVILVTLLFASDASCQTVVTYSSKLSEEVLCPITDQTLTATWTDETTGNTLVNYVKGKPNEIVDPGAKHNNFIYYVNGTSFSLFIQPVQAEDGGDYECNTVGDGGTTNAYTVVVEVLAKPTVKNGSQDVDVLDVIGGTSYDLTCSATGARSVSELHLVWDPSLVENTDLNVTTNGNFTDYSITSTYIAKKGDRSITCQLTGYVTQDEINDQLITDAVNLNVRYAPMCSQVVIQEGEDCREVTLTCDECDAVPADITLYSFFNGSSLIHNGTINMFTTSVAYGTLSSFSCSATNSIGLGDQTPAKDHNCDEATESTTEELKPNPTNEPGGLTTGAKIGISLGAVAVVVVIVVVAVILWKNGEDDSKPSDDQPDDNGAGPGKDPEIPAYGVIDKKKVKDPTPAPRSSMRDSTNSSKPKQEVEMQYADLDHGNKPQSNEVRKPTEEPTEYATVQSVIV